jgi:histidine triad (HIT) family protein
LVHGYGAGVSCAFCAVVAGDVPAHVVLDEEHVVAFLDHRPVFKGHVLLVPRRHVDTLTELPDALVVPLFTAARRLAAAARSGLGAQGTFVAMNNTVSQSVPHLHVHVVPRTKGDGLRGFFWPRTTYQSADEAADHAARLGMALRDGAEPEPPGAAH